MDKKALRLLGLLASVAAASACTPGGSGKSAARSQLGPTQIAAPKLGDQPVTEIKLRLATRSYVAGILDQAFGPSVSDVTGTLLRGNIDQLGGPCDAYGEGCSQSSHSQAPLVPPSTSGREAVVIRACDLSASRDDAIAFAAAQARGGSVTDTLAYPVAKDVAAAFDLFFRGRVTSSDAMTELLKVSDSAQSQGLPPLEAWRFLFLALCLTPHWQTP